MGRARFRVTIEVFDLEGGDAYSPALREFAEVTLPSLGTDDRQTFNWLWSQLIGELVPVGSTIAERRALAGAQASGQAAVFVREILEDAARSER